MSLITKIPNVVFSDATLPKLYRDAAITAGTKFCYDSADTYSYANQAAPTVGVDTWKDLSPAGNDASFAGSAVGFVGGGLDFNTNNNQLIQLPTAGKLAANGGGLLFILWLKHMAAAPGAYAGVAGCADNTGTDLFSIDMGPANSGTYRLTVNGYTGATVTPAVGAVVQTALAAKKLANGTFEYSWYLNGAQQSKVSSSATSLAVPANMTRPQIGGPFTGFGSGGAFRAFRCVFDDVSALADSAAIASLVAADYSANNGRFS